MEQLLAYEDLLVDIGSRLLVNREHVDIVALLVANKRLRIIVLECFSLWRNYARYLGIPLPLNCAPISIIDASRCISKQYHEQFRYFWAIWASEWRCQCGCQWLAALCYLVTNHVRYQSPHRYSN